MSIQVISFNCILKNKAGHLISSTFNRDVLSDSNSDNTLLNGLAKGMQNLIKGERRSISLSAEEAYGLYEPKKVILYPRTKLPRHTQVGEVITITSKSGVRRSYRVMAFHDDMASLDGNHPLAGQDLIFEIETIDAREATSEEIESSTRAITSQVLH
jgi:FKBP-type peptidyl-prolyl cis-trans isomerase SlyD